MTHRLVLAVELTQCGNLAQALAGWQKSFTKRYEKCANDISAIFQGYDLWAHYRAAGMVNSENDPGAGQKGAEDWAQDPQMQNAS